MAPAVLVALAVAVAVLVAVALAALVAVAVALAVLASGAVVAGLPCPSDASSDYLFVVDLFLPAQQPLLVGLLIYPQRSYRVCILVLT